MGRLGRMAVDTSKTLFAGPLSSEDPVNLPRLPAFHASGIRNRDTPSTHGLKPVKQRRISILSFLHYTRADNVDANATWQVDRCAKHEAFQPGIYQRRSRSSNNGLFADDATHQGNRAAILQVPGGIPGQVHLTQQFAVYAEGKLLTRHINQRAKMQLAGRANHGIQRTNSRKGGVDARLATDVETNIAAAPTRADDLVPVLEFLDYGAADGA